MRVVFAAYLYDYGFADRGYGFEYYNFYESLVAMGHDVSYFDLGAALSPAELGGRLLRVVEEQRPDLLFTCLFENDIDPDVIRQISAAGDTVTFNWFCDDHWRFEGFSRLWAPCFNFVSTTAASAVPRYRAAGISNVLKTQWAAASHRYRPEGLPLTHDVTFVGQNYGDRDDIVATLRSAGLLVETWGTGWGVPAWQRRLLSKRGVRQLGGSSFLDRRGGRTRCTQQDMIRVFEQSRVSLNLTAASHGSENQIKGRTFEIPACGGLLMTGPADELASYYEPGREILVYRDTGELVELCTRALRDESWRRAVAEAGYRRTVAEHTYQQRFTALFDAMGLVHHTRRVS